MTRRPHLLHISFDGRWGPTWRLECPYSATEIDNPPERGCNLLTENLERRPQLPEKGRYAYPDRQGVWRYEDGQAVPSDLVPAWVAYETAEEEYEAWMPTPGCFAVSYMEEAGEWEDTLNVTGTDPAFPMKVDVEIDGSAEDAYVAAIVPWTGEGQ